VLIVSTRFLVNEKGAPECAAATSDSGTEAADEHLLFNCFNP